MAVSDSYDDMRCTFHPNVETRLRCSKCVRPICMQCAVNTPVGFRCPDCAGVRGLPTYQTATSTLLMAIGVGAIIAVAVGVLWGFFPDWQFYLSLLLGFGVAESMAWTANYKRGQDLQFAAIACIVVGIVIARVVIAMQNPYGFGIDDLLNNAFDPGVTQVFQLRLIPDMLFVALAIAIPFVRFR